MIRRAAVRWLPMARLLVSRIPVEATAAFGCSNTARCAPTFHSSYSDRPHWKASSADEQDETCGNAFGACSLRREPNAFSREIVNETMLTGSGGLFLVPQALGLPLRLSCLRLSKIGPSKGRGPLIAKYAPVGFKKGFGAVGLGRHTKKGFFLINAMLVPKFHASKVDGFELKPYVSAEAYKVASQMFWEADTE